MQAEALVLQPGTATLLDAEELRKTVDKMHKRKEILYTQSIINLHI